MDRKRFRGRLLGLACGDAVGTTVEFSAPGQRVPVRLAPLPMLFVGQPEQAIETSKPLA